LTPQLTQRQAKTRNMLRLRLQEGIFSRMLLLARSRIVICHRSFLFSMLSLASCPHVLSIHPCCTFWHYCSNCTPLPLLHLFMLTSWSCVVRNPSFRLLLRVCAMECCHIALFHGFFSREATQGIQLNAPAHRECFLCVKRSMICGLIGQTIIKEAENSNFGIFRSSTSTSPPNRLR
jgi:hypothetical protein